MEVGPWGNVALTLNLAMLLSLQMEDDLQPAHGLLARMERSVQGLPDPAFGFVTFFSQQSNIRGLSHRRISGDARQFYYGSNCDCGAVALLFRHEVVAEMVGMLRSNAQERPLDWLIPGWLCGSLRLPCYEGIPNLFQHHGKTSTLKDQDRTGAKSFSFQLDEQGS